jgi:hypothetical protein
MWWVIMLRENYTNIIFGTVYCLVLSPGVKRGRGVTLTTHPHLVAEVKYEYELYLLSPHAPPWRVAGHLFLYLLSEV